MMKNLLTWKKVLTKTGESIPEVCFTTALKLFKEQDPAAKFKVNLLDRYKLILDNLLVSREADIHLVGSRWTFQSHYWKSMQ